MINLKKAFKDNDFILLGAVLVLSIISLLTLYSTGLRGDEPHFFKQLLFFVLGFAAMVVLSQVDYRIFRNYTFITVGVYLATALLLGLVLVLGQRIRGSLSWFAFGPLKFEPVELAKLALIMLLAKYFSLKHIYIAQFRHVAASAIYCLILAALVLMQPDLGSAIILLSIWFGMVLLSGLKMRHLAILIVAAIIISGISWTYMLEDYQIQRIMSFMNPARDPLGSGYNQSQSMIAIGSGGLFGKGLGEGTQVQLDFIPEKETDFIFAAIGEEWGLFGIMLVIILYGLLAWRVYRVISFSENNFGKLFSAGVLVMLFTNILINVGMNIGLSPIAGLSLPFLSYGGSGLLVSFIALGVVLSIKKRSSDKTVDRLEIA